MKKPNVMKNFLMLLFIGAIVSSPISAMRDKKPGIPVDDSGYETPTDQSSTPKECPWAPERKRRPKKKTRRGPEKRPREWETPESAPKKKKRKIDFSNVSNIAVVDNKCTKCNTNFLKVLPDRRDFSKTPFKLTQKPFACEHIFCDWCAFKELEKTYAKNLIPMKDYNLSVLKEQVLYNGNIEKFILVEVTNQEICCAFEKKPILHIIHLEISKSIITDDWKIILFKPCHVEKHGTTWQIKKPLHRIRFGVDKSLCYKETPVDMTRSSGEIKIDNAVITVTGARCPKCEAIEKDDNLLEDDGQFDDEDLDPYKKLNFDLP